jgi:hypothetical protein
MKTTRWSGVLPGRDEGQVSMPARSGGGYGNLPYFA